MLKQFVSVQSQVETTTTYETFPAFDKGPFDLKLN